ncbi:MAG TPA: isochorismatase family cysteine hydrolase [Clostridia bacterium]|nr:isochorismatase family cysteine hydrolase [Clostridia bacterium]
MKKALIVVDYQKDFVIGSLGFPKAEALDETIAAKIQEYRSSGDDIIVTLDTHTEDYLETQEGKSLSVIHCVRGTAGWDLFGETAKQIRETDRKFEKGTFGSLALAEHLKRQGYEQVELVGVVSNICVISNAVLAKAALPESLIIVDAACTASNDDIMNEKALDVMEGIQIKVINRR